MGRILRLIALALLFGVALTDASYGTENVPKNSCSERETAKSSAEWIAILIRNAAMLDEDIPRCIRLCTETIEQAQLAGEDAVVAAAMMQRSGARACHSGIEDGVTDFRKAMEMLPVTVTADIQLLFTQALFFRQKLLGVDQTAFILIPAQMDHNGKYLDVDQNIRMRLLCDVATSRVDSDGGFAEPLLLCTPMLPLTTSHDLYTRMELISLKSQAENAAEESIGRTLSAVTTMLRRDCQHPVTRSLRIEMLLLAARLHLAADNCTRAEDCLNHARNESRLLGCQSTIAACEIEWMEIIGWSDPEQYYGRGLQSVEPLINAINSSDLLERLHTISNNRKAGGFCVRAAFQKLLQERGESVASCALSASQALGRWNTTRVSQMLALQAQRISAAQLRADKEGRRSLTIARIGFGLFCALAIILLRERWLLRNMNQRLKAEILNTDRQRMLKERMELRLAQTERLESLGALAGGIAHDFNNLLVGVIGNADLLRHTEPVSAGGMQCLDGIIRSAETAAGLSHKMLAYAGKQPAMKRVIDLNDAVERMLPLLRAGLGGRHQIGFTPGEGDLLAEVDAEQVDQILLNLVSNAVHATGDNSGVIQITTGCTFLNAVPVDTPTFGNRRIGGPFVWFEVSDPGRGIAENDLARVFEPFYTTKEKSPGHGFGLAVVYGHVNRHDGLIQLTSGLGQGSRFRILLPRSSKSVPFAAEVPDHRMPVRNTARMRVVALDDQKNVLDVVERSLQTISGQCTSFTCATSAMEFLAENQPVDCLLLDMMMPVVDGPSVLEELSNKGIQIPVVLMSGYSSENLGDYSGLPLVRAVLQKPFRPEDLISVLRQAVAAPVGAAMGTETKVIGGRS
jgi:signal transduction histidine kinase